VFRVHAAFRAHCNRSTVDKRSRFRAVAARLLREIGWRILLTRLSLCSEICGTASNVNVLGVELRAWFLGAARRRAPKPDQQYYGSAAEYGHAPTPRRTHNSAVVDGPSGMKPLSLAQEFRLTLLAKHAICLEHLKLLSSAPA
jgi:hypothetical protein